MKYEQALVQFLKVIEVEPMNPRGYTGASEAYVGLGDTDKAIDILQNGLTLLHNNSEIQVALEAVEKLVNPIEKQQESPLPDVKPEASEHSQISENEFSYTNFSYTFDWTRPDWANQEDIGSCDLYFELVGDYSNVSEVRIATWSTEFTSEIINDSADGFSELWRNGYWPDVVSDFKGVVRNSFPVSPHVLGQSGKVLLIVLDANCNAIGYVLVPVTIPGVPGLFA